MRLSPRATATVVVTLAVSVAFLLPGFLTARQRAQQKWTMASLVRAANRVEHGISADGIRDGWNRPLRIHADRGQFLIRSAGSDGEFERGAPHGAISAFEADIVLSNDGFLQYPEGI